MQTLLYAGTTENLEIPKCKNAQVQSIRREVREIELAWLAGIIDGEGCIYFGKRFDGKGKPYHRLSISIANSDVRMIAKASQIYEALNLRFAYQLRTFAKFMKKHQMCIIVDSQGTGRKLLEAIYPYLVSKKDQAKLVLEYFEWRKGYQRGNAIDQNKVIDFSEKLKMLKHQLPNPSQTTRKASKALILDGDIVETA